MKKLILFFSIALCFMSCKSGKIATTETKTDETVIFGRLTVSAEKKVNYKDIWIHFNERLWGKNVARLDENGYFSVKLPLGHNNIAMLAYGKKSKNIPKDYVSIDLTDKDVVYYVGDVHINWNPSNKDRGANLAGALGGVAGALIAANAKGEELPVSVSESDSTILHFKQLFPQNTKEIKTQLVLFNITAE